MTNKSFFVLFIIVMLAIANCQREDEPVKNNQVIRDTVYIDTAYEAEEMYEISYDDE